MKPIRGGQRKGSGRPKLPDAKKKIQWWIYLERGELSAFEAAGGTREMVAQWVRCYPIARGESDRLLAQSPTLLKAIEFLQKLENPPEDLIDELESLLVAHSSSSISIDEGIVRQVGEDFIA